MTEKQLIKLEAEKKRMYEMFSYEREYSDYEYICGIDEVGRGPFAGPVVACAVILPKDCDILYLNDSKKLSEKKREELFTEIKEKAVSYGIGIVSEKVIDEINKLNVVSGVNGSGKSTVGRMFYSFLKGNSTKRRDYFFNRISKEYRIPLSFIVGRMAKLRMITYKSKLYNSNKEK